MIRDSVKIFTATTLGVNAYNIEVEIDLQFCKSVQFHIVGLPDRTITESKQRIISALKNTHIDLQPRKFVINLAPADIKKEGTIFDMAIAVGILQSLTIVNLTNTFINQTLFLGELALDGSIRPIKGALAIAYEAKKLNKIRLIVPKDNESECSQVYGIEIIGINNLRELINYLCGEYKIKPTKFIQKESLIKPKYDIDYDQVVGQYQAKRALQIAAAGNHNIIFIGPPGSGKTLLANRLITIMKPMTISEQLETSKIYSICGKLPENKIINKRPFRSPHHTISQAGMTGGGSKSQPGELSLAHNGILFLDEFVEFNRSVLEVLRQPLEEKKVVIARAQQSLEYPCNFLLVAAMNPCPCGFLGSTLKPCICERQMIYKYLSKLSGPLLDRIDIQLTLQPVPYKDIENKKDNLSSSQMYEAIKVAIKKQHERGIDYNSNINISNIEKICKISESAQQLLKLAFEKLNLSMRGYHKVIKISRTIADLEDSNEVLDKHIKEALMYRSFDKTIEKYRD